MIFIPECDSSIHRHVQQLRETARRVRESCSQLDRNPEGANQISR